MKLYTTRKSYSYSPNPSWYKGILKEYKELMMIDQANKKKIEAVLFGANKIDMNNTLLNNNISTGNVVVVKVENQQQINK